MASMYDIKGFDVTPLDKDKVADFTARMETLQREQLREQKDLQVSTQTDLFLTCVVDAILFLPRRLRTRQNRTSTTRRLASCLTFSKATSISASQIVTAS